MDSNTPQPAPVAPNLVSSPRRTNIRAIVIVVLAIVILIAAVIYAINRGQNEAEQAQNGEQVTSEEQSQFGASENGVAPQTFVYGTWAGENAIIKAFDMKTGGLTTLATLTNRIKKVTVIDSDHLLYIYNTNSQDHGTALALYSIKDGVSAMVYSASQGFGIDDYVISPDKKRVAVWEVKFAPGSTRLSGGASRVYAASLASPNQKNLIYDEVQSGTNPVHYPRAITNAGEVYTDQFLPNTVFGWAYGMSKSNFEGTEKEDIADMQNGSYASQPALSPDGRYLLFTAFTSPRTGITVGNRPTILAGANTLSLYDLQSGEVDNLPNISTSNSYLDARWDNGSGEIIYWALGGPGSNVTGMYKYSRSSEKSSKLPLNDIDTEYAVTTLQNGKILVGVDNADLATVGNLGNAYSPPFNSMYVVNASGTETTDLPLQDNLIQYINIFPASYFSDEGDTAVQAKDKGKKDKGKNKSAKGTTPSANSGSGDFSSECTGFDNLQLCPFYFKAQLEQEREKQQTIPACYDGLIGPECESRGFKKSGEQNDLIAYRACIRTLVRPYRQAGLCGGSPLYLYGRDGQDVMVKVGTGVHGAVPSYNDKNGYAITLRKGGMMEVNGGVFERISYDYDPGIKRIVPPAKGVVVSKKDVAKALEAYAKQLGLNEKETADIVAYGMEKVVSPYVFISYFDQKTSARILPLAISPTPDNYLNVVFYFRLLSQKPPFEVEPLLTPEPVGREGFTAVEVSAIVE
jgi:hypothetical protein